VEKVGRPGEPGQGCKWANTCPMDTSSPHGGHIKARREMLEAVGRRLRPSPWAANSSLEFDSGNSGSFHSRQRDGVGPGKFGLAVIACTNWRLNWILSDTDASSDPPGGESFPAPPLDREGAVHCARGGRAPHPHCFVPSEMAGCASNPEPCWGGLERCEATFGLC
jgi:hypothetical protein